MHQDNAYMRRALFLASKGLGFTSPNPMVGAVIVGPDGNIIGEGYHCVCGGPHAEVNAVNSVSESRTGLFSQSTVYVTLEPCCHYGKTPPCANLLIEKKFKRVVVGTADPFEKVSGKGIAMLRRAGIDVVVGVEQEKCQCLNARFITAHTHQRPFITLKWAQSADGYLNVKATDPMAKTAFKYSSPIGSALVHRLRATHDAIGVGSQTFIDDAPGLDVRYWAGRNPRKVIFDRRGRLGDPVGHDPVEMLHSLYRSGITSILIEGGAKVLSSYIQNGLWDLMRVEVADIEHHDRGGVEAPDISAVPFMTRVIDNNTIYYYSNNPLVNKYFIEHAL